MKSKGFVAVAKHTMAHAFVSTDVLTHTKIVKLKLATMTIRWGNGAVSASAEQNGCKLCKCSTTAPLLNE